MRNVADDAISGTCDPRFRAVGEQFQANFAERDDGAAACAVIHRGELVVDLWGGGWQPNSLVNVFSTTKGMTALCAHILIDRGQLDVDAPVAQYWPEFAQGGKASMPVRYLLSHRAGLNGFREPITHEELYAWYPACERLAAAEPWWTPGSRSSYHAMTFGFLVGEVVRRIAGKTVGQFFRSQVADKLGDVDFYIGVPESEHHRIVDVFGGGGGLAKPKDADPSIIAMVKNTPRIAPDAVNSAAWRSAELPAGNGHGDARSLARVYAALASGGALGGVRLVSTPAIERMREPQPEGVDMYIGSLAGGATMAWRLGFMPNLGGYGPTQTSFGHTGFGGSFAMCDPESELSIAYVTSKLVNGGPPDLRGPMLAYATYQSLG